MSYPGLSDQNENSPIGGLINTGIDIAPTTRKKIEESEKELLNMINAIPQLAWVSAPNGEVILYNEKISLLSGVEKLPNGNWSWEEVIHPDDLSTTLENWNKALKEGTISVEEHRVKMKDGSYRWHLSRSVPVKDENGQVLKWYGTSTDIHDLKTSQEKIRESEEESRLFIEYAPAAMAMFDKEMKYVSVSKRWMKEYDLTGNIIGKKHYELFPNILQRWKDVHSRCMKGAVEKSDEDYYEKDDGSPVWLKWEVHPWYNAKDEIGGIVIFTENITERKEAELIIKESEKRFRLLADSSPVLIWVNGLEGAEFVNRAYLEFLGVEAKDVRNYDWAQFIHLNDRDDYIGGYQKAFSERKSFEAHFRFRRADGEYRWMKSTGLPRFGPTGELQGYIGSTTDIHDLKLAEEKTRESEERFRTMSNEAPMFVWVTNENLQTTYLNKEGLLYFDLDDSFKMPELSWKKFIHPDDIERVLSIMNESANKHESYTLEMRLKNGVTGKYRWFLDKGAPRYCGEKFTGFIGTSLDIHDRKEAEKELEEKVKLRTKELKQRNILLNQQNYLVKKILDSSVDLITVYDKETRFISINQTTLNVLGLNEKDVLGKQLLTVLPNIKDTQGHKDLLKAINGETIHNEIYQSPATGRYYENSLIPLRDDNDEIYAVLVMAHDNTDLIVSSKKLNEAQQIAQIGNWDWDVKSNHLTWSDNLYNMYGVNSAEGVSFEKFVSLIHPDDRSNVEANVEYAFQTQTFNDFFHRIITSAGEEKIIHARGEVIADKNGKVVRMIGTGQDVTKQKRTERQLIETSKKFEERNHFIEQLINSSLDLILVLDKDLRFITVNKKAELLFREIYNQNITGKRIEDIYPKIKDTDYYNDLMEAFKGKVVIRDKVKSTISEKYYEHNYVPLYDENSEVYSVMVISHDVTESIKQMEELKKLSESDVQKNNFITMASHELKTPITSIKGYVQLLLNAFNKENEERSLPPLLVRSSLISVDKQVARLTRLISELLDLSKIETGTLELKKEKFSLNQLAIETVEDILYTNAKHRINLFHDFQGYVYADKDRIGQVMINFLTNAIKYSPNSDRIDITIHQADGGISFSVKDYGIGIDKEEQKKIFDRFYRAKGREEQTYPGFGIGLFIANEFVQKHGGKLVVESNKGKGSVFTFTLPITKD